MGNDIIDTFFKSKKNANSILELEKLLLSNDDDTVISSFDTVDDFFSQIFNKNLMLISQSHSESEEKYRLWIQSRYDDFVTHLVAYLCHDHEKVQGRALEVLMNFVVLEGKNPPKKDVWFFPKKLFQKIIAGMTSQSIDHQRIITKFQEYTTYDDIQMYLLKELLNILQHTEEVTDVFLLNCFNLLTSFTYPKGFSSVDTAIPNTLLSQSGIQKAFHLKGKQFCKLFSDAWVQFLKWPLPLYLLKKVLVILHKKVIPHLQNPCLMTDFLTDAYEEGGVTSLLALNGLFYLMEKYNIEYPDFFQKLYFLFDECIINGKFSARFFRLSQLFLSSTHLPSCIVAAFVKRLSRISLRSKTDCILKIVPFICNLLILHPTLNCLVHRSDPSELSKDPYDFDARNPAESRALESSLWEIKTLQHHVNPEVSRKAKLIDHPLRTIPCDLAKVLDESISSIYKRERKRKYDDAPSAIQRPTKLQKWWILSNKTVL